MPAKMWKSSSILLFYALYILITETAPLRSLRELSISDLGQRAAPTAASSSHDSQITLRTELRQYDHALHRNELSAASTTTRTVTSVVTHTVSWAPPPPTSIKPTKLRTITTNPTTVSATQRNNSRLFGNLAEQPPETLTQTSILLVAGSIMSLSILYLAVSMLCTLSKHRNFRRYCCFCSKAQKENQLRGIELEESAGVSWTEGSNVTTPYPEARLPEGWLGSWADMVAVGGARAFGSTGRAGTGDTVRRSKNGVTRGEGIGGALAGE